jgi:ribose transport system permease protein
LLGGRGFPLATVIAAVFLEQLVTLVNVLGFSAAISPLVQAAALAIGISLYTVNWKAVAQVLTRRPAVSTSPG